MSRRARSQSPVVHSPPAISGWHLLAKTLLPEPTQGSLLVIRSNLGDKVYHCSAGGEWARRTNNFVSAEVGYNPDKYKAQPEACWFIVPACPAVSK